MGRIALYTEVVAYRDERLAQEEKLQRVSRELLEAQLHLADRERTIERLQAHLDEARRRPLHVRIGHGAVFTAVGALSGVVLSIFPVTATGNLHLVLPFVLLGGLFGGLYGLMDDIPRR